VTPFSKLETERRSSESRVRDKVITRGLRPSSVITDSQDPVGGLLCITMRFQIDIMS
jgi:hypothetical protein